MSPVTEQRKELACKAYTIAGSDNTFLTIGETSDRLHLLISISGPEGKACSMEIDSAAWEFILGMKYSDKLEVNRKEREEEAKEGYNADERL